MAWTLLLLSCGVITGAVRAGETPQPPQIVTQPYPTNVANAVDVRLRVEAVGGGTMSYRWYRGASAVGSASTTNVLSFRATPSLEGFYSCVVANEGGAVTSRFVTVTVGRSGGGMAVARSGTFSGLATGAGSGATARWQIRGKHVWLVNGWESQLRVFDISNPDLPVQIANHSMTNGQYEDGRAFDIALVDDTALVAERGNGLGIYDISIPESPRWLGYLKLGSMVNSIKVRGRTAYIGNESNGVAILDVSDPRSPGVIARMPANWANGVFVDDRHLYVARWPLGVSVFDLEASPAPALISSYPSTNQTYPGLAFDVAVRNSIAWLADRTIGIIGVDFSQIGSPVELVRFRSVASGVFTTKSHLFGALDTGLFVADIRNTNTPFALGTIGGLGAVSGAELHGNRLVACSGRFSLFDIEPEGAPPTITSRPEVRRLSAGRSIELEAPVFGAGEKRYQWSLNGNPVAGATNSIFPIPAFGSDQAGDYTVEVASGFGTDAGLIARLELDADESPLPAISQPLLNEANNFGCRIRSRVGEQIAVESSEDLVQWTEREVRTAREPEFRWNESGAGPSARFYRVKRR